MPGSSTGRVQFGVFELDLQRGELRKEGVKVKLQEQPLKVLQVLLENSGQIVTREQLRGRVWPANTFVEFDQGLYSAMTRLRDALGDSSDSPRFIETAARRGYRFIAPVTQPATLTIGESSPKAVPAPETSKPPIFGSWIAIVIAGLLGGAALLGLIFSLDVLGAREWLRGRTASFHSVAVLPLQSLSNDPQQEYFADGMTDALITDLAKTTDLRVISRTSAMHYKGTLKPLPEIARELNVESVVEGSVQRSGNRVRITAQLIRAAVDQHLWAESYERDLRDVLALQDDVAHAIAEQVGSKLAQKNSVHGESRRAVVPEAYEAYLKGQYYWNKRTLESIKKSAEYFQEAIARDPHYAPPYASLAEFYHAASTYGVLTPEESYPQARMLALKALETDSSLAEAHAVYAHALLNEYDWKASENEFRRALELNPGSAQVHYWYGFSYLYPLGRYREAISEMQQARQLDPLSLIINANLGAVYWGARQSDQAIEQCRKTLELDPHFLPAHFNLAWAYQQKGMFDEAIKEMQMATADPNDGAVNPQFLTQLARAYAVAGKKAEALQMMAKVDQMSKQVYVSAWDRATIYAALGEKDRAIAELQLAYQSHDNRMSFLGTDQRLDALRSDPRFETLLRSMNFPQ